MGCMGERVSDGGMIVMICHGDMGLMFFFFFFMCVMVEIVCHVWQR